MSHQNDSGASSSSANIYEHVRRDVRRQTARIYALEAARLLALPYVEGDPFEQDDSDAFHLLRLALSELESR